MLSNDQLKDVLKMSGLFGSVLDIINYINIPILPAEINNKENVIQIWEAKFGDRIPISGIKNGNASVTLVRMYND
jgi:hypothetical protein